MCSQFGFVFFWQKDFGAKAAHKMLVKLTPGDSLAPRYDLQILVSENHKSIYNTTTTESTDILHIVSIEWQILDIYAGQKLY